MRKLFPSTTTLAVMTLAVSIGIASPARAQITFTNSNPNTIPAFGTATTYPSQITVSGYTGSITGITITLTGFSHANTDGVAALFTGPGGLKTLLFDGAGLDAPIGTNGTNVTNLTLTFSDANPLTPTLPVNSNFTSGTYNPGLNQYDSILNSPAPGKPYATDFSALDGLAPDGDYSLYIQDFVNQSPLADGGSIASWSITISGISPVPEPLTTLAGPALLISGIGLWKRLRHRVYLSTNHV